ERRAGDEGGTWGPGWFAVKPNDVSVLAPTDDNRLTLTACHPKYSAKLRIIVQAKLVAEPAEAPTTTVPTTDPATGADGTDDAQTVTPPLETTEDLIAGDPGELAPALLFGGIVIALWLGSMALAALFRRREMRWWPIYIVTTVATVAPLWFCFVHMDRFLPSY
ncbi:MAG TPA: sortase, partial [Microthrixaceae bacterium]|nr:sortase [Microthrixaceae bacterium]